MVVKLKNYDGYGNFRAVTIKSKDKSGYVQDIWITAEDYGHMIYGVGAMWKDKMSAMVIKDLDKLGYFNIEKGRLINLIENSGDSDHYRIPEEE